jgi:hypothetical protein
VRWASFAGHRTLFFERGNFLNSKLVLLALATPILASTVYTDGTFTNGTWQSVALITSPDSSVTIAQGSATGNPGNFASMQFSFFLTPSGVTRTLQSAFIQNDFSWDPALDGSVGSINFSMDVKNLSSPGFSVPVSAFWRPVLRQSGNIFSVANSSLQPTTGGTAFQSFAWNFTSASQWIQSGNASLAPNFSASGAPIQFGFRVEASIVCSGGGICGGTSLNEAMDNYRVEITAAEQTSGIPEPSTWILATTSLVFFAGARRRCRAGGQDKQCRSTSLPKP